MADPKRKKKRLTHVDASGAPRMVDVSRKKVTRRVAVARGEVRMKPETLKAITGGQVEKGDVLNVARIAGIQAAKQTASLVPLCHTLPLDKVEMDISPAGDDTIEIRAEVSAEARTGVEMEALCAVSVAALTIYDMCKALDRGMVIGDIHLLKKSGGRSGDFEFGAAQPGVGGRG